MTGRPDFTTEIAGTVDAGSSGTDWFQQAQDQTQVLKSGSGSGNSTVVLYTVTTGKTLYLTFAFFSVVESGVAVWGGNLFVTNASDVTQYFIFNANGVNEGTGFSSNECVRLANFMVPLKIPTGYKIKIAGSIADAGNLFNGFIQGLEL